MYRMREKLQGTGREEVISGKEGEKTKGREEAMKEWEGKEDTGGSGRHTRILRPLVRNPGPAPGTRQ